MLCNCAEGLHFSALHSIHETCEFTTPFMVHSKTNNTHAQAVYTKPLRSIVCGHGDTHTHTQDNYCNPRCACVPRVNEYADQEYELHMKMV